MFMKAMNRALWSLLVAVALAGYATALLPLADLSV